MRISDTTVSRTHSFFKIKNNRLFVEDNGSKFGTLVKIQRPLEILHSNPEGNSLSTLLQVGRTLLHMNFDTHKVLKWGRSTDASDTSSSSYLQLRKDNLRIPAEFYEFNIQDDTQTQSERLKIPKLNLPVDPVAA